MCVALTFSWLLIISTSSWCMVPLPGEPKLYLPGSARSSATSSVRLRALRSGRVIRIRVTLPIMPTPMKSAATAGGVANIAGAMASVVLVATIRL